MSGVVEFYKEMKKAGLKALIGVEAYITNDPDGIEDNKEKTKDNYHLILIAKDNIGYKKLLWLVSNASINNFYYKPRVWKENLKQCGDGHIIACSACLLSEVAKKGYLENNPEVIDFYHNIFGANYYLELQDWMALDDNPLIQQNYNQWLLMEGRKRNIPFVITTDAHYLRKEDHELHELMMAMQFKKTVKSYKEEGKMIYGTDFYAKTPEEMLRSAKELDCEEAYWNTLEIAKQCQVDIELGKYHMPEFKIEEIKDRKEFEEWKKQTTNI